MENRHGFAQRAYLPVEPVERVAVCMHVQSVDGEVGGGESQALKHLLKRQVSPITVDHHLIRYRAQLFLDEAKEVLLVHTRRQVNVGIHLSHIVEVAVWDSLLFHCADAITLMRAGNKKKPHSRTGIASAFEGERSLG